LNHQYLVKTKETVDTDWLKKSLEGHKILLKGKKITSGESVDIKFVKANMTTCKEITRLKSSFGSKFIATVLDFYRVDEFAFVVTNHYKLCLLDYIHNEEFSGDRMRNVVPVNKICKQIAEGIKYLHNQQIGNYR